MKNESRHPFWSGFLGAADTLRSRMQSGDLRGVFREIESKLCESDCEFGLELLLEKDTAILVLSPEGDASRAESIDRFLAGRPEIPGWRVHGRRPRRSIEDARALVSCTQGVDVDAALFGLDPLDEGWLVMMLTDAPRERAGRALATFLDHALGEDVAMERVKQVIVTSPPARTAHPLTARQVVQRLAADRCIPSTRRSADPSRDESASQLASLLRA